MMMTMVMNENDSQITGAQLLRLLYANQFQRAQQVKAELHFVSDNDEKADNKYNKSEDKSKNDNNNENGNTNNNMILIIGE